MDITWQHIHHPKAIRVLTNASTRAILSYFMLGTESVKSVAEKLNQPLNAVHYQVKQFETLGLIKITHIEPRRGRSIKHYQSTAQGFFVPFVASTSQGLSSFVKQQIEPYFNDFLECLATAGATLIQDINQAGMRFYNDRGQINTDLTPRGQGFDFAEFLSPEAPAIMSSIVPLKLSREDAKNLQLEMLHLLEKYMGLSGSEHYIVHLGLTPEYAE
jgi:hypothetical protein